VEGKKIISLNSILTELKRIFPLNAKLSFPDLCKLYAVYKYIFNLENVTARIDLQL